MLKGLALGFFQELVDDVSPTDRRVERLLVIRLMQLYLQAIDCSTAGL